MDIDGRIKTAVEAAGTSGTQTKGVRFTTAAVVLGEVGDVRRFPSKHHFASYTGTAPFEASSSEVQRHRLSGAGNRKLNSAARKASPTTDASSPTARARRAPAMHERRL